MTDQKKLNIPELSDVKKAHERISPHIHCTPIVTSQFLDAKTGAELFFKCENFQKAGAFKVRGASNAFLASMMQPRRKGSPRIHRAIMRCR
jgi:threonine dehydratase